MPRQRPFRISALRDDSGQAFAILAVSLVALFAMSALVVDVGYAYLVKRRAQAAADASALAAALALPDASTAVAASADLSGKNFPEGAVTLKITSTYGADDTAEAHASATVPSFFSRVLGIDSFSPGASAVARTGSYTGYANVIAPWATDRAGLTFGTTLRFKVSPGDQAASGSFGAVRLPLQGEGCSTGTGANDYRRTIGNSDHSCLVKVGDTLAAEPGNVAITGDALKDRHAIDNFDPNTLLTTGADGVKRLNTTQDPNLVVIPIIEAFTGGTAPARVTGFAWFIVTHYTKDTVEGMFVHSGVPGDNICPTASDPKAPCPVGQYDPDGIKVVVFVS